MKSGVRKLIFSSPIAILYGFRILPIFDMYLYILSSVRKEHTISPPVYKYLFLSFSSLILSKSVFPSNTGLLKAPEYAVIIQDLLLSKNISKGFTQ